MSDARRAQSRAILVFVAVVASLGAAFGACTSYQRANGEDCLKNADCLSGYCLAQTCGNPPPTLIGSSYGDGGAGGGIDAGQDTSTGGGTDSGPAADSSDGGGDSASDGPAAPVDSSLDSALLEDASDASDAALLGDADTSDSTDGAEMDASDSSDGGSDLDGNPDAADAQDALNQTSRRAFFV